MSTQTVSRVDEFKRLTAAKSWRTIDQLVERLDRGGFWSDDVLELATDAYKKACVRKLARAVKDDSGWSLIASIVVTDSEGHKTRVYCQETLFEVEQYKQVVEYHRGMGVKHIHLANGYARRCKERLHVQLPIPFPGRNE